MMLSFFGDAVVAVLLVATIGYAAVLNRRLGVLRSDRARLEELVQGLTAASQRAEAGVAGLRSAAEDIGRQLEQRIEQGRGLCDDLAYMMERGGNIADRLEGSIRARRDEPRPGPKPAAKHEPIVAKPEEPRGAEPTRPAELPRVLETLRRGLRPRTEPKALTAAPAEEDAARRDGMPSRAERELSRALGGRR